MGERLGQDVERLHLHEDEVCGESELGNIEEGSLVWTVDITVGLSDEEGDVLTVVTDTEETDLTLENKDLKTIQIGVELTWIT